MRLISLFIVIVINMTLSEMRVAVRQTFLVMQLVHNGCHTSRTFHSRTRGAWHSLTRCENGSPSLAQRARMSI